MKRAMKDLVRCNNALKGEKDYESFVKNIFDSRKSI
jgi:hypothetical protein